MLHIDIWGHYSLPSIHKHKYFLTIVDDHNRFTWVTLLKGNFKCNSITHSTIKKALSMKQVAYRALSKMLEWKGSINIFEILFKRNTTLKLIHDQISINLGFEPVPSQNNIGLEPETTQFELIPSQNNMGIEPITTLESIIQPITRKSTKTRKTPNYL
ncbi:hypothetical protein CR513_29602, partial [Mucuna pruriens]